jgi:hypothetical protein
MQDVPSDVLEQEGLMSVRAPEWFVDWMTKNEHVSKRCGNLYRYHSRSDTHSKAISRFVLEDLLDACPLLLAHGRTGKVVYHVNLKYLWTKSNKEKTIDLAIGTPVDGAVELLLDEPIAEGTIDRVLLSMEAKTAMTEHGKSQPRIYDELSSSHSIVHGGDDEAIAAGITIVNIADKFVSPLRQRSGQPLEWTKHRQPHAAERMVNHLRGLPIRDDVKETGFDAYTTVVISCDNQGPATLWTAPPAPQPGDSDDYTVFIERISKAYSERFANV